MEAEETAAQDQAPTERDSVKLDWFPNTSSFVLRVPRGEADVSALVREHGLDISDPRSTAAEAVLFTKEPYCAASFGKYASASAMEQLAPMLREIEASRKVSSGAHIRVPMDKELWPFQKADIEYALRRRNTLVGDEPGLGKTPIAIAFANEINAKRVLVICPASIRLQWVKRIREWTTMPWPYYIHPILHSRHGVHPTAQWTIVSYELARQDAIGRSLAKGLYDLLILDEAHYLKSVEARRTRAVFSGQDGVSEPLAARAGAILALTGTPLPNRPREAYTLARGLCFDAIDWMSEDSFTNRFNPSQKVERYDEAKKRTIVYVDERSGRHAELQNRLRANFMTRHLKREVMPQLKLPVYDLIQLDETAAIKQALAAEALLDIDPETLEGKDISVMGDISTVRRMMGIAMAPQVADYVSMLIDGGESKLVLFAWHIEVMDILENKLRKHGLVRFKSGATKHNDIAKAEFIGNPRVQIILGNVMTLGTGTDGLQDVSSHVLIAEPDWTPGNNQQMVDRLDRGGQKQTVQADIFVAPNSLAEKVLAVALRKLSTTNRALDRRTE